METRQSISTVPSKYVVITADYVIPVVIVLATILAWWSVFYTSIFSIKQIECELDFEPCDVPGIIAELDKYRGQNIVSFDEEAIRTRLTSADFTIQNVDIKKTLPSSIKVEMQSVYPTVAAEVVGTGTWVTFDEQLRVIGTRTVHPNVPTITVKELVNIKVGETLSDQNIIKALGLARTLADQIKDFQTVELEGSNIHLTFKSGLKGLMTTSKDTNEQIQALQVLLQDATILQGVSVVDVRFARPVLKP